MIYSILVTHHTDNSYGGDGDGLEVITYLFERSRVFYLYDSGQRCGRRKPDGSRSKPTATHK